MENKINEDFELSINEVRKRIQQSEGPTDKFLEIQEYSKFQSFDSSKNHDEEDICCLQEIIFRNDNLIVHEVQSNSYDDQEPQVDEVEQRSSNEEFEGTSNRKVDDDQRLLFPFYQPINFDLQFPSQQEPEIQTKQQTLVSTKVHTKFPGETKNLPKCLARRIQDYISSVIQDSEDPELKKTVNNPEIKRFLEMKPEKITKQKLDLFIQSEIGSIFCKEFFGNCLWSYGITKEGKTNVETCFRYNIQYFIKSIKKRKLN